MNLENQEDVVFESISDNETYNVYITQPDLSEFALNTFDRIVSDLPSWYGYVAYQVSEDEYFLLTGSEYSVSGSTIYFASGSSLASVFIDQEGNFAFDGTSTNDVQLELESGHIYYTNLVSGYPELASRDLSFQDLLAVALLTAVIGVVFNRVSRR